MDVYTEAWMGLKLVFSKITKKQNKICNIM